MDLISLRKTLETIVSTFKKDLALELIPLISCTSCFSPHLIFHNSIQFLRGSIVSISIFLPRTDVSQPFHSVSTILHDLGSGTFCDCPHSRIVFNMVHNRKSFKMFSNGKQQGAFLIGRLLDVSYSTSLFQSLFFRLVPKKYPGLMGEGEVQNATVKRRPGTKYFYGWQMTASKREDLVNNRLFLSARHP